MSPTSIVYRLIGLVSMATGVVIGSDAYFIAGAIAGPIWFIVATLEDDR